MLVDWLFNQSMGRPSKALERRAQIVEAFSDLLATAGYEGATIAALADQAGVTAGIVHHYFRDKEEILTQLIDELERAMAHRLRARLSESAASAFIEASLTLDARADVRMARCWVGILAEAQRNPHVMRKLRRISQKQFTWLVTKAGLSDAEALALMSFVVGAVVFGTVHTPSVPGFAAPAAKRLLSQR